jgi:mannose-6-phosphate isomerase-like protein (cupin superfamily)
VSLERWLVLAAVVLAGCGSAPPPNPRLMLRYDKNLEIADLNSLIRRAGPGPVAALDLGHTAWVSHHLAVIRGEEVAHYHRFHDLTVVVLRGEGVMDIEGRKYEMRPGDVLVVSRGTRHFFRNTGDDLCAAFVTFSPPFDGRDTVTAEDVHGAEPAKPPAPAEKAPPAAKSGDGASP